MEIEQLQLWARWLELQRDRTVAVLELEEKEAAQVYRIVEKAKKKQNILVPHCWDKKGVLPQVQLEV